MVFINLEKAYNRVSRKVLWWGAIEEITSSHICKQYYKHILGGSHKCKGA